jgi:hypothetical protein
MLLLDIVIFPVNCKDGNNVLLFKVVIFELIFNNYVFRLYAFEPILIILKFDIFKSDVIVLLVAGTFKICE